MRQTGLGGRFVTDQELLLKPVRATQWNRHNDPTLTLSQRTLFENWCEQISLHPPAPSRPVSDAEPMEYCTTTQYTTAFGQTYVTRYREKTVEELMVYYVTERSGDAGVSARIKSDLVEALRPANRYTNRTEVEIRTGSRVRIISLE